MRKTRKQKLLLLGILPLLLTGCSVSVATFTPTAQPQVATTTVSTSASTLTPILSSSTLALPTLANTPSVPATTKPANSPTATVPPTFTPVMAPTPTPEPYNLAVSATTVIPTTATTLLPTTTATTAKLLGTATPVVFTPGTTPDAQEQQFIQLLNAYRQANKLNPLTFDPRLFQSSSWMAKDMATKNYVSHTDSLHRDIPTRIHAFGYPGPIVGENIAGGFANAQDNLNIWQSDQIHKDNLLGKYYKYVGVSRYYEANSLNKWYWVLDMGG